MIDLHCHILPGVDDGADSLATACAMADMAARSGVDTIVATPHCNTHSPLKNYRSETLLEKFVVLQAAIDRHHIPVKVLPGAEVLARSNLSRLLAENKLLTVNGSRYLLIEFYFDEDPLFINDSLRLVRKQGYVPVVAHPERYHAVQANPSLAYRWFFDGYALQLNKGSLLGRLGQPAFETAEHLLRRGFVSLIASDAHSSRVRTPDMTQLCCYLEQRCPREFLNLLLFENPHRIICNLPLVPVDQPLR